MNYVLFINQTSGLINHVMIPGNPADYPDGSILNGELLKHHASSEPAEVIIQTYWYNGAALVVRPTQTSKYQKFVNGSWVFPEDYIEQAQAELIRDIKETAGEEILASYPFYKQLNIIYDAIETNTVPEDIAFIKAIRDQSNEDEALVTSKTTLIELEATRQGKKWGTLKYPYPKITV